VTTRVLYADITEALLGQVLTAVSHAGEVPGRLEYDFGNSLGTISGFRATADPVAVVIEVGGDGAGMVEFGVGPDGWIEVD